MKITRNVLSVLMAAVILAATVPLNGISAYSAKIIDSGYCGLGGDDVTWTLDSEGVLTISGTGKMDWYDPWIPSPFNDKGKISTVNIADGVTSIGSFAFSYYTDLESVTIPDSVNYIDDCAFYACSNLSSIEIPYSVKSMGDHVFFLCGNIKSITVENGNNVYHSSENCLIETESKKLVFGCKNCAIPQNGSVTSIGDGAFSGNNSLVSITIPHGVKSIDDQAFFGCSNLASITIPASMSSFGFQVFDDCGNLKSITVEDGNKTYHSSGNCLIETESKKLIYGCSNCNIPSDGSVTSIEDDAFSGRSSLASVTIPNSVRSIGNRAFFGCCSLSSVTIPDSVTSIGWRAFDTSTDEGEPGRLTDVYYCGSEENWNQIEIEEGNDDLLNAHIHFISSGEETTEPLTTDVPPTTAKQIPSDTQALTTTEAPPTDPVPAKTLESKDPEKAVVNPDKKQVAVLPSTSLDELKDLLGGDVTIVDAEGSAIDPGKKIGTGAFVKTADGAEFTVIVPGDVDGDGSVKAVDARAALRAASRIEPLTGAFETAADVSGDAKVKAADARSILRIAAKLDSSSLKKIPDAA